MSNSQQPTKPGGNGFRARATNRVKRLFGPTLGVFGLDADGHLVSPRTDADKGVEAQVREADEKDDHARLAISEAEIATERSEKQQGDSGPAPLKG